MGCGYLRTLRFGPGPDEANLIFNNRSTDGEDDLLPQPVPNTWGEWSAWTDCSRSCESGRQSRMRQCNLEEKAIIDCTGERVQVRQCNTHECPSEPFFNNLCLIS